MISAGDNGLLTDLLKPHEVFALVFPFLDSSSRSIMEDLSWLTKQVPILQVKTMS